jgi:hypothetical protein
MYTIVIMSVELAAVDNVRTLLANFIVLVSVLLPVASCVMAKVIFCPVTILVMAFKVMLPVAVMVCIEPRLMFGVIVPVALPNAYGGCVKVMAFTSPVTLMPVVDMVTMLAVALATAIVMELLAVAMFTLLVPFSILVPLPPPPEIP